MTFFDRKWGFVDIVRAVILAAGTRFSYRCRSEEVVVVEDFTVD